ncbi:hypothetical protein Ae201684P_010841 [Aphanomyces euteiches]|uniref:HTH CENPB-type domain-containing protein n=1 Tax=Aphanomyces euteiches TaxID=100861 RepID=A0A6G0WIC1_9STRA|nr:hypothetical protein Ae201684_014960 [Aphanomyces euteiches]KAH9076911.1 hypothetical protein Ae201684P_010841 [Aphanomyces euteiches]
MSKKRMTLHEKNLLRMKWKSQPHSTYAELGVWAAHEFKLLNPPTKSAICKILKKQDVERNDVKTKKNDSSVRFLTIENELSSWVLTCEAKRVSITSDLIKQQAEAFCNVHEIPVQSRLVFSNGWLEKFQKHHGFTSKIQHGEARSACKDAVDNGRKAMLDLTAGYNSRDVFNMDETAYFYALAPHRSITRNSLPGLKKSKKRITIALTTNATGTDMIEPLFIGKSKKRRCFRGQESQVLGIRYTSSKKAWMNSQIFNSYLDDLNKSMVMQDRKILLLVDNVSSHKLATDLTNVELKTLPPNTTAYLQPLDAVIIAAFKAKIKKKQLEYALRQVNGVLSGR